MQWTVSKLAEIKASPAEVFDVISDVEHYSSYSSVIREVRKAGDGSYRWVTRLAGIRVTWDGIVTRSEKPSYFAWRAIRGMQNSGSFSLAATDRGTMVRLKMSFHPPAGLVLGLLKPIALPIIGKAGEDILWAVTIALENSEHPHAV